MMYINDVYKMIHKYDVLVLTAVRHPAHDIHAHITYSSANALINTCYLFSYYQFHIRRMMALQSVAIVFASCLLLLAAG